MRLLILGTGRMAASHARHFAAIDGVTLVGGVDIDPDNLEAFRAEHGIAEGFASLDAALAWGKFDAVSNVTPDSVHHATTMAALAVGKHVFCEKPLATDYAKALEMTGAAESAGLVAMVNLTYRNVAQLQKARELVAAGAIGTIRHIEASYLQGWLSPRDWNDPTIAGPWLWRLSRKHGSNGVLGDLGIHIVDFASYAAGSAVTALFCRLRTFDKTTGGTLGEYDLDANDSFSMTATFANGALGSIHSSRWATGHANDLRLRLYGEKGGIEVTHGNAGSALRICTGADIESNAWRDLAAGPVPTNYQRFAAAVKAGKTAEPSFRTAADLQRVLDLAIVTDGQGREMEIES